MVVCVIILSSTFNWFKDSPMCRCHRLCVMNDDFLGLMFQVLRIGFVLWQRLPAATVGRVWVRRKCTWRDLSNNRLECFCRRPSLPTLEHCLALKYLLAGRSSWDPAVHNNRNEIFVISAIFCYHAVKCR